MEIVLYCLLWVRRWKERKSQTRPTQRSEERRESVTLRMERKDMNLDQMDWY